MKVVVDTNVLVSAILKGRVPRAVIQFIVAHPDWQWIVSQEIVREYKEVLSRRKFKLTDEVISEWFEIIDTFITLIDVNVEIDFPRDRKDAKFLACAVAAEADFLITGDSDFNQAQTLLNTTIISVSLFNSLVCQEGK
ncbi:MULTISPECIES: putative toxin-antitoxin system toxin component, PIN family [Cyanophyceae]|uniref:putative toxin-antitoxin system toxin component, PIN family n=1 Tax=Cyanophyceae TaxID=3028117 RepID=UPI00232E3CEF|nr:MULTISPECIES: putative toxin-antitoxin system toxin component, PIN family [Cyanophyceae]MDB9356410.1 putative toxin-antitoxin system toxin component, PIN family [Nodularia spumigena CS-587/03]MDB9340540.1 putative toxin-antitoxin system toxin component, PIN family [Nodularia spumigena CS-589/07]MDB9401543.1 putative toxin-antitoxin system toxin component, PIN family [Microcystis aeruginosa CS-567/02-A1]MDB9497284.1 putative toxin-antitoxin system toxin component, PIN family [Nodularia spumig